MSAHFNFYSELGLDPSNDSAALGQVLDQRLAEFQQRGLPSTSGEVQVVLTARAILTDLQKRMSYDQRLNDPSAPAMDAAALRNLAQTGQFEPSNQFAAFQNQPGQNGQNQYQPMPTPKPARQVTKAPLPELPADASVGDLWKRTSGLPRFFTIAQLVAGVIPALSFVYLIFVSFTLMGDNLGGMDTFMDELGYAGRTIALAVLPVFALILVPTFAMQLYWAWQALHANKPNYLIPFLVTQVPIALVAFVLMISAGFMGSYFLLFWHFLWLAASVTGIVLGCLPAVRAWFNNEVLTVQSA